MVNTMKSHFWNTDELRILENWDWVSKFIDAQNPESIPVNETIRRLYLEAQLIISNKLVIVYSSDTLNPVTIISFKELVVLRELNKRKNSKTMYHPINFKSLIDFRNYLSQIREKIFSLSN
jgi:hypothetical protein